MSDNPETMNVRVAWSPELAADARLVNYFSVLAGGTSSVGVADPLIYLIAANVAPPILPDDEAVKSFVEGGATLTPRVEAAIAMPIGRAEELVTLLQGQIAAYKQVTGQ